MLKFYSRLIGEDPKITKDYYPGSKRKIVLLGNVLLIPVIMWILMGFLVSKVVLQQTTTVAVITALVLGFLIFLIERSIVMARGNRWLVAFRIVLGLVTAILGSVGLDEVVFKNDIDKKMAEYKKADIKKAGEDVDYEYSIALRDAAEEVSSWKGKWQNGKEETKVESDGKGGTGNVGYGDIAKLKDRYAEEDKVEYLRAKKSLEELESKIAAEKLDAQAKAEVDFNDHALLIRIKALFDLVQTDPYMKWIYIIFTAFLFLLEFIVVIIKTTTKNSIDEDKELIQEEMRRVNLELLKGRKQQYARPQDLLPEVQGAKSLVSNQIARMNLL
ncbi:DUF4407 domain-containing protein [Gilvibacter sp.]|uniref:DUF4407 domain-containing protein n=1 Tax=Gilvibacter sp. TaxID=2729997 RepID=UPI003B527B08